MNACLACGAAKTIRFGLSVWVGVRSAGKETSRGAGSIRLCEKCWRLGTHGHRYLRVEGMCRNNLHRMDPENIEVRPSDGMKRCRACHSAARTRALSRDRHKTLVRGGNPWPEERRLRLAATMRAKHEAVSA